MKNSPTRLILYVTDIMAITGKSARSAQRIAEAIRKKYGGPFISIDTFCEYTRLQIDMVLKVLNE